MLIVAACATAGAAAYGGRGYLEDSWWIWKLGSKERLTRMEAAVALAETKCVRAVPRIVDAIARDPEEGITTTTSLLVTERSDKGAPRDWERFEQDEATPVVFALWDMGEPALPALRRCAEARDPDPRMQRILERLLDRSALLTLKRPVVCK